MKILLKGGGEYEITDLELRLLQDSYPRVDVAEQCKAMAQWCRANPTRRKTERGVRRFINSWLARSHEKAPKRGPVYAAAHKPFGKTDLRTSEADKRAGEANLRRLKAIQEARAAEDADREMLGDDADYGLGPIGFK